MRGSGGWRGGVLSIALLCAGCAHRHAVDQFMSPGEAVKEGYYRSIPSISFMMSEERGRARDVLLPFGREMQRLLAHDLGDPGSSRGTRMKSLFALEGFWEKGRRECLGTIIPTLIRLFEESEPYEKLMILRALGELAPHGLRLPEGWFPWWLEEGQWIHRDTCESPAT